MSCWGFHNSTRVCRRLSLQRLSLFIAFPCFTVCDSGNFWARWIMGWGATRDADGQHARTSYSADYLFGQLTGMKSLNLCQCTVVQSKWYDQNNGGFNYWYLINWHRVKASKNAWEEVLAQAMWKFSTPFNQHHVVPCRFAAQRARPPLCATT